MVITPRVYYFENVFFYITTACQLIQICINLKYTCLYNQRRKSSAHPLFSMLCFETIIERLHILTEVKSLLVFICSIIESIYMIKFIVLIVIDIN